MSDTKGQVSTDYVESLKNRHQNSKRNPVRRAIISGWREGEHSSVAAEVEKTLMRSRFDQVIRIGRAEGCHVRTEISDDYSAQLAMDEAFELLDGPPDVLVTSTGEVIQKWFEDIAAYEWQSMFDDNFFSHVYLAQEFVRRTIEDEWRKYIVVVSSMSGTGYMNGSMPYCTAKAACNMLVKGMAWELAPKNYLVSGVAPNSLENSEMVHQIRRELTKFRGLTPQQAFEYWSAGQLLPKRMLTDDVAKMVGVLVSGEWDFMAGEVMEARMATR